MIGHENDASYWFLMWLEGVFLLIVRTVSEMMFLGEVIGVKKMKVKVGGYEARLVGRSLILFSGGFSTLEIRPLLLPRGPAELNWVDCVLSSHLTSHLADFSSLRSQHSFAIALSLTPVSRPPPAHTGAGGSHYRRPQDRESSIGTVQLATLKTR